MAAPQINGTQSVLNPLQGQSFAFQPTATNSPSAWEVSALPPGLTLNASTGAISGTPTQAGVFVVTFTAKNADGASSAVFTMGVEASAQSDGLDTDLTFDVISKAVALASAQSLIRAGGAGPATGAAAGVDGVPDPLFIAKLGDDQILRLHLQKNGSTVAATPSAITLRIYSTSEDGPLLTSSAFVPIGEGSAARFRLHAKMDTPALQSAVSDEAGTRQARAKLYATVSVTYTNATLALGGTPHTITSDAFGVEVFA